MVPETPLLESGKLTELLKRAGVGLATLPGDVTLGMVGLPAAARTLYRGMNDTADLPEMDSPLMALSRRAADANNAIHDKVESFAGVKPAESALEVASEVGPQMLTGVGLAKLPGMAGRLAAKVSPTTVKGAGVATGLVTGVDQGLRAYVDSQYPQGKGEQSPSLDAGVPADPFDIPTTNQSAPQISQAPQTPALRTETSQQADPFDIPQVASDPFDIPAATQQDEQSLPAQMLDSVLQFAQEQYKPLIAGTVAVVGGLYVKKAATARAVAQQSGQLVGTTDTERALTRTQKLNSSLLDESAALKDTFKGSTAEKADFSAAAATSGSPVAINHKVTAALHDGDLPGVDLKFDFTPKLWHDGRAMLQPQDAQVLNDALIARSELVARTKEGYSPSFRKSQPELEQMVEAGLANPAIAKMMGHYDNIMSTSLGYLERSGIISSEKAQALRTEFPHYVPFFEAEGKSNFFTRLADNTMSYQDRKSFSELTNLLAREGGLARTGDPGGAMEQYISHMIRLSEMNKVRGAWIDNALASKSKFITKAGKEGDDTVTLFRNGAREVYKVSDPDIRSALEMSPKVVAPTLNAARRAFQAATTGVLAPWYAVKAMTYDALMASSTAPAGFGLFRGEPVSALAGAGSGMTRAAYGHLVRAARDGFQKTLLSDELGRPSILAQVMPKGMIERLADITATAYANSTLSLFERSGAGGGGRFTEHQNYRNFQTQMQRISPDISTSPTATRLHNFYRAAMDSAQNAVRLEYMARGVKRGQTLPQLSQETRELTGDFARRGSSRLSAAYAQTVPYGNVSLQSLARWGTALHDNPIGTVLGVLNTVAIPSLAAGLYGAQDASWNEYLRSLPMDERNGNLFFYIPGVAPERMPRFALPSEMHPIKAAADSLFSSLFDYNNPSIRDALADLLEGRGHDAVKAGMERAAPPMLPIGVSAAGAAFGQDIQQRGFGLDVRPIERQVQGQPTLTTDVELPYTAGSGSDLVHSNYVRNLVSHVLGSLGSLVMGTLGAAEQGYRGSGGDKYTALADATSHLGYEMVKKVPSFAPLWGQDVAPGLRTYEHVRAQDKLRSLGDIEKQVQAAVRDPAKQLLSPLALQVGSHFASYSKQYAPLLEQRKDILKRLDASKSNVAIGPTMRMEERTGLMKELQQVEGILGEAIANLEADVSEKVGKRFRVEDFRRDL